MHKVVHPTYPYNGYNRHKVERDAVSRADNKLQTMKTNSSWTSFGKMGSFESSSSERLVHITSCLIGHEVDVCLLDGSIYSGIFQARNAENCEIVLEKAGLVKGGSGCSKDISGNTTGMLVISLADLEQVKAKGVPLTRDEQTTELLQQNQLKHFTDSCLSKSQKVERELERWVPDANDPSCPDMENTFDSNMNRSWDQFETNETLFGVKTTYCEELYTTKLEKGPCTRDQERMAELIEREIEETSDLHLAEERGIQIAENFETDEETRYSSVHRRVDDNGIDESSETVGDGTQVSSEYSSKGSSWTATSMGVHSASEDYGKKSITEQSLKQTSVTEMTRISDNQFSGTCEDTMEDKEVPLMLDQNQSSKAEDSNSTQNSNKKSLGKSKLSPNAIAFYPSHDSIKNQEKVSTSGVSPEDPIPPTIQVNTGSLAQPSSSAAPTISDCGGVTSTSTGQGLSASSSSGSLSAEKPTLYINAKEFELNPNAMSFFPSQPPLRHLPPPGNNPLYHQPSMPFMQHMRSMPVGMGPVLYNPYAPPMAHSYYYPNGPQYGQQQVMFGQPRPFMYMPPYPADMSYKGRGNSN
ncbi:polyadenylate-binding protein-interacting protein 4-like isoform X2 [Andrographis paniculata]|uniref:polyadenylate-binding protein-interacting protein 4-like isoform X2 n=1 Tax=Andrographis paniculata TaxID=175694 RepID=UPI0021E9473D|nr:polyadenylate-binding protein-interacting protein 4-like isoform X2 [Andrographis paniculata]